MVLNRKISTKKRLSSSKKRRLAKKISRRRQNGGERGYEYCMIKIGKFSHGTKALFGHCNENIAQHLTPAQIKELERELQTMENIIYTPQRYQYLFGYILQLCGYYAYRYNKENKIPNFSLYGINFKDKIDGIIYNILILMFILTNNIHNDLFYKPETPIYDILNNSVFKLLLDDGDINITCNNPEYNKDAIFNYIICVIEQCLEYIRDNPDKKFKMPNYEEFIKGKTLAFLKKSKETFKYIISPLTIPSSGSVNLQQYVTYMSTKSKPIQIDDIYFDLYKYLKGYVSFEDPEKNIFKYISKKLFIPYEEAQVPPSINRSTKPINVNNLSIVDTSVLETAVTQTSIYDEDEIGIIKREIRRRREESSA
jgi:hypothetical protein